MPKYIVPPGNPLNSNSIPIEIKTDGPPPDEDLGKSILGLDMEELAKNPPPEYKRIYEAYLDAVARDRLQAWLEVKNPESVAIALLVAHSEWSVKDIADKLKCDRKTPYRWPTFMTYFKMGKESRKAERRKMTPSGSKFPTEDGLVFDAIDPASEEENDSEDLD